MLAVKAQHTAAALERLLPHLAGDGFVLSAQNGLNESLIAERAGEARTMGCFVNFGADWIEPGRIVYGGRGEVVVGEIDGPGPAAHGGDVLAALDFEPAAVLYVEIWGYLWGKLGFAAMLFATSFEQRQHGREFSPIRRAFRHSFGSALEGDGRGEGSLHQTRGDHEVFTRKPSCRGRWRRLPGSAWRRSRSVARARRSKTPADSGATSRCGSAVPKSTKFSGKVAELGRQLPV